MVRSHWLVLSALLLAACQQESAPATGPAAQLQSVQFATREDAESEREDDGRFSNHDVVFSFVVVGCNRVDKADTNKARNPSTANLEQLNRTFAEVSELNPRPRFVFFAGDMVFGYTPDTVSMDSQLRAWRTLYDASPLARTGTILVPIPGNHEVQNAQKVAYAAAERTWLRVMWNDIAPFGGNGPAAGGADGLATDQSYLTYSFNYKRTHFLLLDTDPVGRDWTVPTKWIASDLAHARGRHARHIFAIGHKPAWAYPGNPTDGLGHGVTTAVDYNAMRDEFWASLEQNRAEAMLAAHDHVYYRTQPNPSGTWQIISGNGGSVLEADAAAYNSRFYGFTVVTVHRDGSVTATEYGRDVPAAGYLTSSTAYPTTVRDTFTLRTER